MDPEKKIEQKDERVPIKSLRTYQGDVEELMAKNNYSATTVLVAEQKRRLAVPRAQAAPVNLESRNKFFTILGITLLFLGVATVGVVYFIKSMDQTVVIQQTKAILPFSTEKSFNIASSSRENLLTFILQEKASVQLPVNSVMFLNILINETDEAGAEKLLSLLGPNMPASLSRSFEDTYMVGIFSYDTNEPFIILTTKDYANSFSGMLKWEKDMSTDLGRLFDITQNTSSTTPVFTDEALRNKDLRILKDENRKTILMYSFIDKNTLVITKNESIFNAILAKYTTSKNTR